MNLENLRRNNSYYFLKKSADYEFEVFINIFITIICTIRLIYLSVLNIIGILINMNNSQLFISIFFILIRD